MISICVVSIETLIKFARNSYLLNDVSSPCFLAYFYFYYFPIEYFKACLS
jgi:hypothetical protein